jgi:2-amino-4-hydroxy-6-hydroxymethyldihydropteridine diphosphokinase
MHTAYIGLGANLPSAAGEPAATLEAAAARLGSLGRVARVSSLYSTEPVGYADQPRFVNAVAALETDLGAGELLDALMRIEREFGRDRAHSIPNGPRMLDLDILLFDDCVIDEPGLQIPHPRLAERAFVLVPLCEIAPDAVNPHSGATVAQLLSRLSSAQDDSGKAVVRMERARSGGARSS